jgi:uncharacterized membrane protein
VDLYQWLLALHLLAAASLVAALTLFTVLVLSTRGTDVPSKVARFWGLGRFGTVIVSIGTLGTLFFGIWLAIDADAYHVWDGWVIAAIVLWLIGGALGKRTGDGYRESAEMAARLTSSGSPRSPELAAAMGATPAFWFHVATCVVVLLLILDMIWKPGA